MALTSHHRYRWLEAVSYEPEQIVPAGVIPRAGICVALRSGYRKRGEPAA